jgi:hypothetical protein
MLISGSFSLSRDCNNPRYQPYSYRATKALPEPFSEGDSICEGTSCTDFAAYLPTNSSPFSGLKSAKNPALPARPS